MRRAMVAILLAAGLCGSLACGDTEDSFVLSAVQGLVESVSGEPDADDEAAGGDWGDSETADGEREVVVIESGEFSSLEEAAPAKNEVPFYSYVDENGAAHMVKGLYNVPARYRKKARSLSKSGLPAINRYDEQEVSRRVIAYQPAYNPNRNDVLLYSAEWCGACRKAKTFLDKEGVPYDLLDIDADPRAKEEVRRVLGRVRIPLLDINGTYVAGFSPKQIRKALRKSG